MSSFPLSLPPPADNVWGWGVLQENPELLEGDVIHNIVIYLQTRLKYRLDAGDSNRWIPPRDLMARGEGNCEDTALVALSILSAAGFPGGIAWYYNSTEGIGHTVAFVEVKTCCETFVRIIDSTAERGVSEWEAEDLASFKETFGYPQFERVWG